MQQVTAYAVMELPRPARDVLLLYRIQGLDNATIGRLLRLTEREVQAHMATAICQATVTVKLIENLRPERLDASAPEVRHD